MPSMISPPPNTASAPISAEEQAAAPSQPAQEAVVNTGVVEPTGWRELRADTDIQFEEFAMAAPEPREPGWFDELWAAVAEFFASILGPVGDFIAQNWGVLKWALLGLLALFVLYWLVRSIGPLARLRFNANDAATGASSNPDWQPTREESVALLEDADKLAAQGRFDEATHLLLKRSVSQIADSRPDWVEPSSTARELAALPALSARARTAFHAIAERVERSLFALRTLDRSDWEAARAAYAEFASISISGPTEEAL